MTSKVHSELYGEHTGHQNAGYFQGDVKWNRFTFSGGVRAERNKVDSDEQDSLRGRVVLIGVSLSSFFDLNVPFSMTQRIDRVQRAFEKVLKKQLFTEKDRALR